MAPRKASKPRNVRRGKAKATRRHDKPTARDVARKAGARDTIGRPSKLEEPRVRARLLEAIKIGNYYDAACGYAGVSYKTFREWIVRGEADSKTGVRSIYADFRDAVQEAELQAEAIVVALWRAQMPNDWRAAKDFLVRRYRRNWQDQGGVAGLLGLGEGGSVNVIIPIREVVVNLPAKVAMEYGIETAIPIELPGRGEEA